MTMTSELVKFHLNGGKNRSNYSLEDILKFNDKRIEGTHDFIQWVFPTTEKSSAVFYAPKLSDADLVILANSTVMLSNLERTTEWYLDFLLRNSFWKKQYDHNHLRITRVIKSLGTLHGNALASWLLTQVKNSAGNKLDKMKTAVEYWDAALSESEPKP